MLKKFTGQNPEHEEYPIAEVMVGFTLLIAALILLFVDIQFFTKNQETGLFALFLLLGLMTLSVAMVYLIKNAVYVED